VGRSSDAKAMLAEAIERAKKAGAGLFELEARLALAEVNCGAKAKSCATTARALSANAKAKGFLRIARLAAQLSN
jgi:hypothetical protein